MSSKFTKSDLQSRCSTTDERKLTSDETATSKKIDLEKLHEFIISVIDKMVSKIDSSVNDILKKGQVIYLKLRRICQATDIENYVCVSSLKTLSKLSSFNQSLTLELKELISRFRELLSKINVIKKEFSSAFQNEFSISEISKNSTMAMNKDMLISSNFRTFSDHLADIFGKGTDICIRILTEVDICASRILPGMSFADVEVFVENPESDSNALNSRLKTDFSINETLPLNVLITSKLDAIIEYLPIIIACNLIKIDVINNVMNELLSTVPDIQD